MTDRVLKLITEYNHPVGFVPSDFDIMVEEREIGDEIQKILMFRGPMLRADTWNENDRRYPANVIIPASERYMEERVTKRGGYGELGHPDNVEINYDRVSHLITDLTWDGDIGIGTGEVFEETPKGAILKTFIERQCQVGMSSRGLGDLKTVGEAQFDVMEFELIAIDAVADPSTPGAFVDGVLESKNYIIESSGEIREVEQAYSVLENRVSTLRPHTRTQVLREAFHEFLENLDNV